MSRRVLCQKLGGGVNNDFVFVVKSDNAGTSASNQFTINADGVLGSSGTWLYNVSTSDGYTATGVGAGLHTITFPSGAGTHTVTISGQFSRIYFANSLDRLKFLGINNWGNVGWNSNQKDAFYGCSNFTFIPSDQPDFFNLITVGDSTFRNCAFDGLPTGTTLNALQNGASMFRDFIEGLNVPDTVTLASCSNMIFMFENAVIPTPQYSQLLINIEANNPFNNITLSAQGSKYNTSAITARNVLVSAPRSWIIYDQQSTFTTQITDLSLVRASGVSLNVAWSAPTCINTITGYQMYLNGVLKVTVTNLNYTFTGLNQLTSYNLKVRAIDNLGNTSDFDEIIESTTVYQGYTDGLFAYYKMQNNIDDSWGVNNGAPTDITYAAGLVGQAAVFNGSTSNIQIPSVSNLNFSNGTNDLPFSVVGVYEINSGTNRYLFGKTNGSQRVYELIYEGTILKFRKFSNLSGSVFLEKRYTWSPVIGQKYIIIITDEGLANTSGMHLYIDSSTEVGTNFTSGNYVKMGINTSPIWLGKYPTLTSYTINGQEDEIAIFSVALNTTEISEIITQLNSGQSLM